MENSYTIPELKINEVKQRRRQEYTNDDERLKSFNDFPQNTKLSVFILSLLGFYYFEGRIYCNQCSYATSNFITLSIQILIKKHLESSSKQQCPNIKIHFEFLHRTTPKLDPIPASVKNTDKKFSDADDRERSFENIEFTDFNTKRLAENGFFMVESFNHNSFLVQIECVFCGYTTVIFRTRSYNTNYNSPYQEHKEKSPNCKIFNGQNFFADLHQKIMVNDLINPKENDQTNKTFRVALQKVIVKKSDEPHNKGYMDEEARKESFRESSFDPHLIEQFIKAGFYYTGTLDIVKCFFCNGGIRNWDPIDDPIDEHARWFPRCSYIKQIKGQEFIEGIRIRYKDKDSGFDELYDESPQYYDIVIGVDSTSKINTKNDETESHEQTKLPILTQRELNARMESNGIRQLIETAGFDPQAVKKTILKKYETENTEYSDLVELAQDYFKEEKEASILKAELKNAFHLCFSDLPDDVNEIKLNKVLLVVFQIKPKNTFKLKDETNDSTILVCLKDEDLMRCKEIVEKLNGKPLPGTNEKRISVRQLLDDTEIQDKLKNLGYEENYFSNSGENYLSNSIHQPTERKFPLPECENSDKLSFSSVKTYKSTTPQTPPASLEKPSYSKTSQAAASINNNRNDSLLSNRNSFGSTSSLNNNYKPENLTTSQSSFKPFDCITLDSNLRNSNLPPSLYVPNQTMKTEYYDKPKTQAKTKSVLNDPDLQEKLIKLREERLCVKCRKDEKEITFLPCSHFVTCSKCAVECKLCPVKTCKKRVEATVKTFT